MKERQASSTHATQADRDPLSGAVEDLEAVTSPAGPQVSASHESEADKKISQARLSKLAKRAAALRRQG